MARSQLILSSNVPSDASFVINDPAHIPHVGSTVDTPKGIRQVYKLHYDFAADGALLAHAYVQYPGDCNGA